MCSLQIASFTGDQTREFSNALIEACGHSTLLNYHPSRSLMRLEGRLIYNNTRPIGYRYDRTTHSGDRQERLLASEERHSLRVQFTLVEVASGKVLYGPVELREQVDFDFIQDDSLQEAGIPTAPNQFEPTLFLSLGQLDTRQGAREGARPSLYQKLATKVCRTVEHHLLQTYKGKDRPERD